MYFSIMCWQHSELWFDCYSCCELYCGAPFIHRICDSGTSRSPLQINTNDYLVQAVCFRGLDWLIICLSDLRYLCIVRVISVGSSSGTSCWECTYSLLCIHVHEALLGFVTWVYNIYINNKCTKLQKYATPFWQSSCLTSQL